MANMFCYANAFNSSIGQWNVSKVSTMANMFLGARNFNQSISTWNTSNVVNMEAMFNDAIKFNQMINTNGNNWNVSNVVNMNYMFKNALNFNQSISAWNTSNVTSMDSMFKNAYSFNKPINSWNVSKVVNMSEMFKNATNFNQSIGSWNFSSVTSITNFIANTGHSLNDTFSLLSNISSNTTTNNKSFGILPNCRDASFNTISTILTSKNISYSIPKIYTLIMSNIYYKSYTFSINYNSAVVFSGFIIVDYYNNIIYLEDTSISDVNILLLDYNFAADYLFINNNFSDNGINLKSIPYFNKIYTNANQFQLYKNGLSYNDNSNNWFDISGVTITNITITVASLNKNTHVATQLKNREFFTSELKSIGFVATQLKNVGYSVNEIINAEYKVSELINANFTLTQLHDGGILAIELKKLGYSMTQLINAGYTQAELLTAGYNVIDLNPSLSTLSSFINNSSVYVQLKKDFTLAQLISAEYPLSVLKLIGYTPKELFDAQKSVIDIKNAGYLSSEFYSSGIPALNIGTNLFSLSELKTTGYICKDLYNTGFTLQQLKDVGFLPIDLRPTGATVSTLKNLTNTTNSAFTVKQYAAATYTPNEILGGGFKLPSFNLSSTTSVPLSYFKQYNTMYVSYSGSPYPTTTKFDKALLTRVKTYTPSNQAGPGYLLADVIAAGII